MRIRVTVSALIRYNEFFLLCQQKKDRGIYLDTFHIPGGGVEDGEDCLQALKREVLEECGIEIKNIHRFGFSDRIINVQGEEVHYIFLRYIAESCSMIVSPGDDVEKVFWVKKENIFNYNHNQVTLEFLHDLQVANVL